MKRLLFFLCTVCTTLEMNAQKPEQFLMPNETSVEGYQKYVGENIVFIGNVNTLDNKDALAMTPNVEYKIDEVGETGNGIVSFALTNQKDGTHIVQHIAFSKRTALEYGVLQSNQLKAIRCTAFNDAMTTTKSKEYTAGGFRFKIEKFSFRIGEESENKLIVNATFKDIDQGDSYTETIKDFQDASINLAVARLPEAKVRAAQEESSALRQELKKMKEAEERRIKEEQAAKESGDEVDPVIAFPVLEPGTPHKVYVELIGHARPLSLKVTVDVDFGQVQKLFGSTPFLVDSQTGKKIVFNSMVDALNYFGRLGWNFEQAYAATEPVKKGFGGGTQNVYHWLLSKTVTNDSEITQGITTKKDIKK